MRTSEVHVSEFQGLIMNDDLSSSFSIGNCFAFENEPTELKTAVSQVVLFNQPIY